MSEKIEKICGIYALYNQYSGKRYVGQSHHIYGRYQDHITEMLAGRHKNQHLQFAFDKYAPIFDCVFELRILEECDPCMLDEREVFWISFYSTMNDLYGYNLKSGGNARSYYSEESCKKISDSLRGRKPPENAIIANTVRMTNMWKDAEYRQKMSEMARGENNAMYGMSGELCPFYGRSHSDYSKDLVRQAKNEWWSKNRDHFDGEKNPFFGKTHPPDVVRIISEKNKKKWLDPEHRRKYCKPVVQLDLNGNYIQRFDSQKEASLSVGSDGVLSSAFARSGSKPCMAKGYKWMYESDYFEMIGGDASNAS